MRTQSDDAPRKRMTRSGEVGNTCSHLYVELTEVLKLVAGLHKVMTKSGEVGNPHSHLWAGLTEVEVGRRSAQGDDEVWGGG